MSLFEKSTRGTSTKQMSASNTSNFQILSNMSSSTDKDTLIDEMQQKIGDLLKCNQELCVLRKENESLKQQISNLHIQSISTKEEYDREIEQLKKVISQHIETEKQLNEKLEQLSDSNSKYKSQITQFQYQMSKMQENTEQLSEKYMKQISQNKSTIEDKDKRISELKGQIKELKTQSSIDSNAFLQQKAEFEKLGEESIEYQNQIDQFQKKFKLQNRALKQLNSQVKQKDLSINELQSQIDAYTEHESKLSTEITTLNDSVNGKDHRIQELEEMCAQIIKFCKVENYESVFDYIKKKRHENKMLKRAIKSSQKVMKESQVTYQNNHNAFEEKLIEVSDQRDEARKEIINLREIIKGKEMENENLIIRLARFEKRDLIRGTVSNCNKLLVDRIYRIYSLVDPDKELPTLKSIIHASLMLRRWIKLQGTKKKYEKDGRNWWWLVPNDGDHSDKFYFAVQDKLVQLSDEQKKNEKLTLENSEMSDRIQTLEKEIAQKNELLSENQSRIENMENSIKEKTKILESKVSKEDMDIVCDKYSQLKKYLKSTLASVQQKDEQINELSTSLANIQQDHECSIRESESINAELEEAQKSNEKLQDELELVYHALNEKNREMLLLERKIALGESEKSVMHSHISSVVADNQRLNKADYSSINIRNCEDSDISHRLRIMANNLSGTLCD
ncbi:hypothetical protein TRFO_15227 [Tritrichomonas foetus]|uniref:Uncharacterized protein n=1 Tax=Tritrichomonas foetus TaxID=1144522 RepID=A0A1J4KTH0_9EUKA|nr:hypothetical protein TRFO_15227 [Tritrichomonas foetus]|eukprot:OHT14434.1 hypothetical protein TRFO_15227 [Tritrichomonas foetus]